MSHTHTPDPTHIDPNVVLDLTPLVVCVVIGAVVGVVVCAVVCVVVCVGNNTTTCVIEDRSESLFHA
jgi:hypothetical protein